MEMMFEQVRKFIANDSGATAIEYALLCVLIGCAIVVAVTALGSSLQNSYNEVSSNLN